MKNSKRFLALLLGFTMFFAACTPTAPTPATPDSSTPTPSTPGTVTPAEWQPFDENGQPLRTDRDATGSEGVIASSNYYASKIGLDILESGGNAVDAAVAVGFALGVAEPFTSGLGGGGFMVIRSAKTGEVTFIDFREIAPAAATPEIWQLGPDGKVIGNQKAEGGKSVAVPGEVSGLLYALETYGTMDRKDVIQPSIDLANNGFTVSTNLHAAMLDNYETLSKYGEMADLYLNTGLAYEVGETFRNPDLAKTLGIIADKGRDGFYKGEVAQAFVNTVNKYGGLMTMEDLENYNHSIRDVVQGTYRGYDIISASPSSSGGAHLIQMLNILENYDLAAMEVNSAEYLHLFSETFKMAFADRAQYMADTAFQDVPLAGLTSKEYAKVLSDKIDPATSGTYSYDNPGRYESGSTTHFSIADKEGNIVAVTQTINYFFGSKLAVGGYGFIPNNEMDDFVTGNESVNRVEPGKKPLSSMTPTIILKDGKPFATIGSPGATRIFPTLAQVISHVIDHDMDIQEAIDTPRIFDNTANKIHIEGGIKAEEIAKLKAMGHEVEERAEWDNYFGGVQGIVYLEDGTMRGGADPRRDGKALGFNK